MNFDMLFFVDAFRDLSSFVTFLILGSMMFFLIIQIIAWLTPPNPKFLHVFGIGIFWVAFSLFAIYNNFSLAPALIRAGIEGVYGYPGYFWVGSLIFIIFIFMINTIMSWKENKPLEVFQ